MTHKTILSFLLLGLALGIYPITQARPETEETSIEMDSTEQQSLPPEYPISYLRHTATHMATAHSALIAQIALMILAAELTRKILKNSNSELSYPFAPVYASIAGCLTGLYIQYKTPQWTDEYLLKLERKRSTPKNVIELLSKLVIPFPIATLLEESFQWLEDLKAFEKQSNEATSDL